MKKSIRGMTLTALLLSASQMAFADDSNNQYDGDGFVTPVAYVGDVPTKSEDAYFAATAEEAARATQRAQARPAQVAPQPVQRRVARPAPVQPAVLNTAPAPQVQPVQYAPLSISHLQPAGVQQVGCSCSMMGGGCDSPGCASMGGCSIGSGFAGGCDSGGCDSMGCSSGSCGGGGLASAMGLCGKSGWARHEVLLWFLQDRSAPSLIATAPVGTLPRLPAATTVFGDTLNGDMSVGYRGDMGLFLSDNLGVGGRFWVLSENEDEYSIADNGNNISIGRPFFNVLTDAEDALIVAFQNVFTGSVSGTSKLDMMAAEAYARVNLGCTKTCQLDLIGGYSYMSVDDELSLTSTTITQATGRTRTYNDLFDTENVLHGGQIGFEAVVTNGRWFARSLTKVHMGNMDQTVRISGSSTDQTPPAAAAAANSGLLTLGNQGTWNRDEFTFIPEINFKLGYRFREHVEMTVGYSFLMFDNLALAGEHVDRVIDPSSLNTSGPFGNRPAFAWNDSSLWVQGIDLGMAITF